MGSPFADGVPQEYAQPVRAGSRRPLKYEQLTSLASATALTVPEGARFALVQAETQAVRWRDDGTDPTGTVGVKIVVDAVLEYHGDLTKIRFIEAAASAKLSVSYYA